MNNLIKLFSARSLKCGFTLIELMIVVIILGALAALGMTGYGNMMEKQYCKTAQLNLAAIYSAAEIYKIGHRTYHTPNDDLTGINTDLQLNINDPKFTYTWHGASANYTAFTVRTGGPAYQCSLSYGTILGSTNPWCTSATYCGTNYLDR